jgi:hypothetical protein
MYNSFVRFAFVSTTLLAALFLFGCTKDINNKEAVKEAVMKRLATVSGLNMSGMEVEISSVSFQGNEADAKVAFKAKGTNDSMLNMSYKLERKGDEWIVKSSSGGMGGMGGGSNLPPGHPPASQGGAK